MRFFCVFFFLLVKFVHAKVLTCLNANPDTFLQRIVLVFCALIGERRTYFSRTFWYPLCINAHINNTKISSCVFFSNKPSIFQPINSNKHPETKQKKTQTTRTTHRSDAPGTLRDVTLARGWSPSVVELVRRLWIYVRTSWVASRVSLFFRASDPETRARVRVMNGCEGGVN